MRGHVLGEGPGRGRRPGLIGRLLDAWLDVPLPLAILWSALLSFLAVTFLLTACADGAEAAPAGFGIAAATGEVPAVKGEGPACPPAPPLPPAGGIPWPKPLYGRVGVVMAGAVIAIVVLWGLWALIFAARISIEEGDFVAAGGLVLMVLFVLGLLLAILAEADGAEPSVSQICNPQSVLVALGPVWAIRNENSPPVCPPSQGQEARAGAGGPRPPAAESVARLLAAIRQVESSGAEHPPDGDGGRAIGPYQIHRPYWADSGIAGAYEECRGEPYARRVVLAYWRRWAPAALARGDAETLARVHNGGPRGAGKAATRAYWEKVRKAM